MARSVKIFEPVVLHRIVDGDTLEFNVDLGLMQWSHQVPIRLNGVDTPEIHGVSKADVEYMAGMEAVARIRAYFDAATGPLKLYTYKVSGKPLKDKYGRVLADVFVPIGMNVLNLSNRLLAERHARPYAGEKKEPWVLLRPLGIEDLDPMTVANNITESPPP